MAVGYRFWYENPGVFKPEQLTQIKQSTLARVICDSSDDILEVTKNVFKMPNLQTPSFVTCNQISKVELRFWAECCHGNNTDNLKIRNTKNSHQTFQNAAMLASSIPLHAGQNVHSTTRIRKTNLLTEKHPSYLLNHRHRIAFTTIRSLATRSPLVPANE